MEVRVLSAAPRFAPKELRVAKATWRRFGVERVRRSSKSVDGLDQDDMWYVYIIRSVSSPAEEYTGITADLKQRLTDHNSGKSKHTSKFMPWKLQFYCAFPDKRTAWEFKKYLKSHSGRAFAKKRLIKTVNQL